MKVPKRGAVVVFQQSACVPVSGWELSLPPPDSRGQKLLDRATQGRDAGPRCVLKLKMDHSVTFSRSCKPKTFQGKMILVTCHRRTF